MINNDIAVEPKSRSKVHKLNYSDSSNGSSNQNKNSIDSINKATYNKYTDSPIQLSQVMSLGENKNEQKQQQNSSSTHNSNQQPQTPPPSVASTSPTHLRSNTLLESSEAKSKALLIGTDPSKLDPVSASIICVHKIKEN